MKKRIFLVVISIALFNGSLDAYSLSWVKKFIPSWRTLSYVFSSVVFFKGLQKINDNWHWNRYCDDDGDVSGDQGVIFKRRNTINHDNVNEIKSVTNKTFTFPVRRWTCANSVIQGTERSAVVYMTTLQKFWGIMEQPLTIITDHSNGCEYVMVFDKWPSKREFRKGLFMASVGAASLLGTTAYKALSKRNILKALQ